MKKIVRFFVIAIIAIFLLLLLIPVIYKSKLVELVKTEINSSLKANVEFSDVDLSLLKNFPDFYFALNNLSVVGQEEFSKDTLLAFKSLQLNVNLMSVINGSQIKINSIFIDQPSVHAKVLKNGAANWDIAKETTDSTPTDSVEESTTAFNLNLKKFAIQNANIIYEDQESNMSAELQHLDFILSGDFTQDITQINTNLAIEQLTFMMDGISYLKNVKISYIAGLNADLNNYKFTLKDNTFKINEITFGFAGFVAMPDDDINIDLKFNLDKTTFKDLLSLVPVVYQTDFENIETEGTFSFSGFAKGVYTNNLLPSFNISFVVNNAMFKYPDLPDAVDHINIDASVSNPGGTEDQTLVDVNRFQLRLADNPVNFIMHLKTPVSDPEFTTALKANLDFSSISTIMPLEGMKLSGLLNANFTAKGKLSTLENEKYEEFDANGTFALSGFKLEMNDLPYNIDISKASLSFSPKYTKLNSFNMKIGESDFNLKGEFSNYIPYAFDKGILVGNLTYTSNYINVDELMETDTITAEEESVQDTVPLTVIEIPGNVAFYLKTNIKKINYDALVINNLSGNIKLKDKKANLKNIKMYMLNGILAMNGEYNTQKLNEPKVDFKMEISGFDIASTYQTINTIQALTPAAKNMQGNFSTGFTFKSLLNKNMEPIYNTILSDGRLITQSIELKGSKVMNKIGQAINSNKFDNLELKDIDIKYHIEDGVIKVKPFTVKAGNMKTEISGQQGIDKSIDYKMTFDIPSKTLGTAANSALSKLTGTKVSSLNTVKINALVTGSFDDPSVKIVPGNSESIVDDVKDIVDNKKEEAKKKAKKEAKAKAQKIINDANKKAEKIIAEAEKSANYVKKQAKNAGDKLVSKAEKQGNDLIAKAGSNIIKKKLARETAKKLNKEAEEKANKLNKEADNKARQIIEKAKQEANNIRKKAQKRADAI
ncbi:MAG: AsmA family protein [Chlorobi bacterium]|nr:AsmA family protein [Chlorobiota bacterium]